MAKDDNIIKYKKVDKNNSKKAVKKKNVVSKTDITKQNQTNKTNKNKNINNNNKSNKNKKNNKVKKSVTNKIKTKNSNNENNIKKINEELDVNYIPNFEKEIQAKKRKVNKTNKSENKGNSKNEKDSNIGLIIMIILLILFGLAIYFCIYSSYFRLTNINVTSNNIISSEEVLNVCNIQINESSNTLVSYFDINKESILEIPYVKDVNITIESNNTINIDIEERTSYYFAYNTANKLYYKLDENGYILQECTTLKLDSNEILLYGINFEEDVILGYQINTEDLNKLIECKVIEDEIITNIDDTIITKITIDNYLYKLKINDKLEVIFDDIDDIEYSIEFLKAMLLEVGISDGSIDFTTSNPVFIRNS